MLLLQLLLQRRLLRPCSSAQSQAASLNALQQDVVLQVHGALAQGARVLALQPRVYTLHVEGVPAPGEDLGVVCSRRNSSSTPFRDRQGCRQSACLGRHWPTQQQLSHLLSYLIAAVPLPCLWSSCYTGMTRGCCRMTCCTASRQPGRSEQDTPAAHQHTKGGADTQ